MLNNIYDTIVDLIIKETEFSKEFAEEILEEGIVYIEEALKEMDRKLKDEENYCEIAKDLHQIKGLAGNLQILEMAEQAREAEETIETEQYGETKIFIQNIKTFLATLKRS